MTPEKRVSQLIKSLLSDPYFVSIQNRLDAGVQRKTLNVQAWEHILLADSLLDFHIKKRDELYPEIQYLDDDDLTNDDIKKVKDEVGRDIGDLAKK